MNRTLKRGLMYTTILGAVAVLPFSLLKGKEETNPRVLTPERIRCANPLSYEGNKQERRPTREFFLYENVLHTQENENTYVRTVEEENFGRPDSAWKYPDLDGINGVAPKRSF